MTSVGSSASFYRKSLRLNIAGSKFVLCLKDIQRYPTSFLSEFCKLDHEQRLRRCHGFLEASREYFFDASPPAFAAIADFYRNGVLHIPHGACLSPFVDELEFWKIGTQELGKCCREQIPAYFEKFAKPPEDEFASLKVSVFRRWLHETLETNLTTSGKIFSAITLSFILLALVLLLIGADPLVQYSLHVASISDVTDLIIGSFAIFRIQSTNERENGTVLFEDILKTALSGEEMWRRLTYLNYACITYFSLEYLVRLWAAPSRLKFARTPVNVLDACATLAFYLEKIVLAIATYDQYTSPYYEIVRVLRVVRLTRALEFVKYSVGMQAVALTLRRCYKTFLSLSIFITVMVLCYSYLIVVLERESNSGQFYSIAQGMYWSIVTLTTIGYGDAYPTTTGGKVLTCIVAVSGMIFMAFPVSIIVNSFVEVYHEISQKREFEERQKKLLSDLSKSNSSYGESPELPARSRALQTTESTLRELSPATLAIEDSTDTISGACLNMPYTASTTGLNGYCNRGVMSGSDNNCNADSSIRQRRRWSQFGAIFNRSDYINMANMPTRMTQRRQTEFIPSASAVLEEQSRRYSLKFAYGSSVSASSGNRF